MTKLVGDLDRIARLAVGSILPALGFDFAGVGFGRATTIAGLG